MFSLWWSGACRRELYSLSLIDLFFSFLFFLLPQELHLGPVCFLYFNFSPYFFNFCFWSFYRSFICFQFHHSIPIYQILYFLIWSLFFLFLIVFFDFFVKVLLVFNFILQSKLVLIFFYF
jgi:hypothetical protein